MLQASKKPCVWDLKRVGWNTLTQNTVVNTHPLACCKIGHHVARSSYGASAKTHPLALQSLSANTNLESSTSSIQHAYACGQPRFIFLAGRGHA